MSVVGTHMPGRLTPPKFASENDKAMFEYAQQRIADDQDLDFYRAAHNDGFVKSPEGKPVQINFR